MRPRRSVTTQQRSVRVRFGLRRSARILREDRVRAAQRGVRLPEPALDARRPWAKPASPRPASGHVQHLLQSNSDRVGRLCGR